jgi:hypothetical protein
MQSMEWADYDAARAAFKAALLAGDGLDLGNVKHHHAVFGPYSVYQWAAFIAAHEARHCAQMKEAAGLDG